MAETFIKKFEIDDLTICDNLINYFKENNEYKQPGKVGICSDSPDKKSTDVYVFNQSKNSIVKKYFSNLSNFICQYLDYYNLDYYVTTKEPTNIQYYKKGEGYYTWHCERFNNDSVQSKRAFVFMTYLNDVKNAGTEFLYQKKKFQAKKGLTLIWPSDFTHTHKGIISETQEKYIITGWFHFSSPEDLKSVN